MSFYLESTKTKKKPSTFLAYYQTKNQHEDGIVHKKKNQIYERIRNWLNQIGISFFFLQNMRFFLICFFFSTANNLLKYFVIWTHAVNGLCISVLFCCLFVCVFVYFVYILYKIMCSSSIIVVISNREVRMERRKNGTTKQPNTNARKPNQIVCF